MASPAAAPPAEWSDDAPISMEGRARLLEMTFGLLLTSIFVLPLLALTLTLFYAQGHEARWMWVWCGFYVLFAGVMFVQRRIHLRDRERLDADALVHKWKLRPSTVRCCTAQASPRPWPSWPAMRATTSPCCCW